MIRIGIIGTENSHAMAFSKYFNLPNEKTGKVPYEDVRVVAVMGDEASTSAIVQQTGVEFVAQKVEDFFGRVDAIMITSRRGSVHKEYAMPFVEKGMPIFVDKPFTSDPAEAEELAAQIKAYNCPVFGGSGCKNVPHIRQIKELVAQLREKDEFITASMSFRVQMDSVYDGLYFYAPHLVEMCLEAFGPDVKNVQAMRTGDNMLVMAQYEKQAVSLHFVASGKPACLVYGKYENYCFDIDMSQIYPIEAAYFAELLHGRAPSLSAEKLTKPVHMVAAIQKSLDTGKAVSL